MIRSGDPPDGQIHALTVSRRKQYIDWARGFAVLVMIEAHVLDAWTRPEDRSSISFRNLTIVGGFAAPLFLFLAGLATVLAAEAFLRRTANRRLARLKVARRGVEIFVLAFLFRLQAFIISPGSSPVALLRVDILNVMGPSLTAAAFVWALGRRRAVLVGAYGAIAAGISMVTPVVRVASWVDAVPPLVQWYVRPADGHTTFTLFPWSGFVFAGAAAGTFLAQVPSEGEDVLHLGLTAVGAALTLLGFYTGSLPSIYPSSSFWTSSPAYFLLRVGVLLLILEVAYAVLRLVPATSRILYPLERLGRSSLFIYWIHVELVYGYATWPIHGKLWLWQVLIAYIVFAGLMYSALPLKDRVVSAWQIGRGGPSAPVPLA